MKSSLLLRSRLRLMCRPCRPGAARRAFLSAGGAYPWVESSVSGDMDPFIKSLGQYQIKDLRVKEQTLEERFLHLYGGNSNDK